MLEGRDYSSAGATNTRYDPRGYLLVSVLGNYNLQEPTAAQLETLSRVFAWAEPELGIAEEKLIGHSDVADTDCPGASLQRPLKNGMLLERAREIQAVF